MLTDNVQEPNLFVVIEISQVVGKISKVIASPQPESIANLAIDTEQEAFSRRTIRKKRNSQ